jgi:hypothetical protein
MVVRGVEPVPLFRRDTAARHALKEFVGFNGGRHIVLLPKLMWQMLSEFLINFNSYLITYSTSKRFSVGIGDIGVAV